MRSRSFLIVGGRITTQIRKAVEPYGETLVASTVAQATRALVDVGGFTGIFADTKLADGTGFDVLERDRALDRDTPALAVSHRKRDWRPESLRAFDCRAEFIVAPVQSRLFVVCVKRWDEQQAKDEAEDELFIQTHAANIGQTPEQVKAEVQSLLAKTGARTLAALARRFRWEVARRAPKWDPSPTRH